MRILISAESFFPRSNGVTNSVIRSARFLKNNEHEVLILAQGDGPRFVDGHEVLRVPALSLHKYATVDFPVVSQKRLTSIIEEFDPDVIHLASPFFLGHQVRKVGNELSIPVVAVYQTDVSGFASFYRLNILRSYGDIKIRKIHSKSDLNLVPSSASENYLSSLGVENIKRWTRGVDIDSFNPKWRSDELRKKWGNEIVIGYVGRLAPEKQVEKLTSLSDINAKLVVVGDGPSRTELERALPNAIFTGHKSGEELSRVMASFDILVTTGEHETFCQVIQEGMESGLPVVAPNIGGPVDLITNGVDGFLTTPGDPIDLKNKVNWLISNQSERSLMGLTAYNKVQGKTWDSVCAELLEHYKSVAFERVRFVS